MHPFHWSSFESNVVSNVALVGKKEFMQTLREKDTPCFSIATKPKKEIVEKLQDRPNKGQWWESVGPNEVRDLLEQYHGIFIDSIPTSLPPKR